MTPHVGLYRWDELTLDKITEMVASKAITGTSATLTQSYFKKGAIVPRHTRATELFIYVLQGAIRARVHGEDVTVREGNVVIVPAGVPHESEALDDTFVMTVAAALKAPDGIAPVADRLSL
jgi:quercetin dioxygenase-like cupin family protein